MHNSYPPYPGYQPQPQRQPDGSMVFQLAGPPGGGYQPPMPYQGAPAPQYQAPPQQQPQYGAPPPQQPWQGQPPMGPPPGYQQPPQQQPWQQQPPMPQGYPPQTQGPMVAPQAYIPSDQEFAAMRQRAQQQQDQINAARAGGGGNRRNRELRFLGPNGEKRWAGVPVGYRRTLVFRLLPAPGPGRAHFHEAPKHFWKSAKNPAGFGGWCSAQCMLCAAIEAGLGSGQEHIQKKAKMARAKTSRLYQGLCYGSIDPMAPQYLDNRGWVDLHRDETGRVRPLVYSAPSDVHMALMEQAAQHGLHTLLDLQRGEPMIITRKKTGNEEVNVGYDVVDGRRFAGPIPQEFGFGPNGEGLEIFDLQKFAAPMTSEQQQAAIAELQLSSGQQYSYGAGPGQPPATSPYAPQQPPPQQAPWQPPTNLPPVGGQPAQGQWAGQQPPVLPSSGQPPPASYGAPRDPWAEGQSQQRPGEPPPGWQPPPPQQQQTQPPAGAPGWPSSAPPSSGNWTAPPPAQNPAQSQWGQPPAQAPNPALQAFQQQMTGGGSGGGGPSPGANGSGPGPAYPPPPGASAPPPR